MTRRSKIWLVIVLLSLINLAGVVFAAARGELLHTGAHAGLLLLGAYLVWRLAPWRDAHRLWGRKGNVNPVLSAELTDRLTHLEQSVDAIAIEIERIGEGQRFITRRFTENGASRAPGVDAAEPIEIKARAAAPDVRRD